MPDKLDYPDPLIKEPPPNPEGDLNDPGRAPIPPNEPHGEQPPRPALPPMKTKPQI